MSGTRSKLLQIAPDFRKKVLVGHPHEHLGPKTLLLSEIVPLVEPIRQCISVGRRTPERHVLFADVIDIF